MAVACAMLALIVLAGCQAPERIVVTADDDDGTVRVRNGGVVLVELEGNPTTGYMWMEQTVPPVLESLGEAEFVAGSEVLGAGGTITLTFEAVEAGEGTLDLAYLRPWESVQPEDTFSVTVVVEE
jgi:inhibitor of cysteine peptidase